MFSAVREVPIIISSVERLVCDDFKAAKHCKVYRNRPRNASSQTSVWHKLMDCGPRAKITLKRGMFLFFLNLLQPIFRVPLLAPTLGYTK